MRFFEKAARVHFTHRDGLNILLVFRRGNFNGNIRLLEAGDLIVIWRFGVGFVSGAVNQMQVQAGRTLADQDALFGLPDARRTRRTDVGEEHAFPDCGALTAFHVVHVKNNFREAFVEDSGLHLERSLRALEPVLQTSESGLRCGSQVDAVD